jgi:hypothetical protein
MKSPFSSLSQQLQLVFVLIPVYVSDTQNPDAETEQQVIARQDRFLKLSKGTRWKLASFEVGDKIQAIGQKYGFELLRLANITRLIREYYFGEVRFEDFPTEIEKRVGVSLLTAQEITRRVKNEIIDWDPWAEYIAKLPKMTAREIFEKKSKIADTEITSGYVELGGSEDLDDPTIKNWIQDYVSHLGYAKHSQMERTQYLFHSENGKNLSSPDREKLGIILKSFDENIPLPVDKENNEIVFDGQETKINDQQKSMINSRPSTNNDQRTTINYSAPAITPKFQPTALKQESFIKPYNPAQPQRPTSPQPSPYKGEGARPEPVRPIPAPPHSFSAPAQTAPPQNFVKPNPIRPQPKPFVPAPEPEEYVHPNLVTQPSKQMSHELNKYFNAPETPDIPSIKIHSITERAEPRVVPRQNIQPPAPTPSRPQHRIIDPFPERFSEPKIDGNVVDLSNNSQ